MCLKCHKILCSRYIHGHMAAHSAESNHLLAVSFSDLSVWCFGCDAYIGSPLLNHLHDALYLAKVAWCLEVFT